MHRQGENDVVPGLEQIGGFVQIGDAAHFPGAVAGLGADQIPTATGGRYKNGCGYGFDITIPSNE